MRLSLVNFERILEIMVKKMYLLIEQKLSTQHETHFNQMG